MYNNHGVSGRCRQHQCVDTTASSHELLKFELQVYHFVFPMADVRFPFRRINFETISCQLSPTCYTTILRIDFHIQARCSWQRHLMESRLSTLETSWNDFKLSTSQEINEAATSRYIQDRCLKIMEDRWYMTFPSCQSRFFDLRFGHLPQIGIKYTI